MYVLHLSPKPINPRSLARLMAKKLEAGISLDLLRHIAMWFPPVKQMLHSLLLLLPRYIWERTTNELESIQRRQHMRLRARTYCILLTDPH